MLKKIQPALRPALILFSFLGMLLGSVLRGASPENSQAFQIEIPEAKIESTPDTNLNLESKDIQVILIHISSPEADGIEYGQIFPKVNGAAASRITETRPGLHGKVLRMSLKLRPGFELLPGNNKIEVQATSNGQALGAAFNLHTPAGPCRGNGRSKILALTSLQDLLHAGVTMDRLVQLVVACGVNFPSSTATDQKLQDLGAEPKLLAAIHNPIDPQFQGYQTSAVKLNQVLELIRSRVAEAQIIAMAEDDGVAFSLNPETEQNLRSAGASQKLIQTIAYMSGQKMPEADSQALSLSQILQLLQSGEMARDRVFTLVQTRGVSFKLDGTSEDRLRSAGANEKLMVAIREASERYQTTH